MNTTTNNTTAAREAEFVHLLKQIAPADRADVMRELIAIASGAKPQTVSVAR